MTEILDYLARFCSFLWAGSRYRIVDSAVSPSFGGDAWVTVASDELRLRFVRDRGQLMLDVQGPADGKDWYSIDLLRRLITGERQDSALLDAGYAAFLREHLARIESLFFPEEAAETRSRLRELKRKRAKELFG